MKRYTSDNTAMMTLAFALNIFMFAFVISFIVPIIEFILYFYV